MDEAREQQAKQMKRRGQITQAEALAEIKRSPTVLPGCAKVEHHGFHKRIVSAD